MIEFPVGMNLVDLGEFRAWFSAFVRGFCHNAADEDLRNYRLKEEHTLRVCEDIRLVALAEGAGSNRVLLAEAAALFHDTGRFPQYAQFRTFRDGLSANHGSLGVDVLLKAGILNRLPEREKSIILSAVRYHNAFSLPQLEDPEAVDILKLVRDADKLDIWRVMIEYFGQESNERASAVGLGLPEGKGPGEKALSRILRNETVPLTEVHTLDDFKLMLLSWMSGLHFRTSLRLVAERGYIDKLDSFLPRTAGVERAVAHIRRYVKERA